MGRTLAAVLKDNGLVCFFLTVSSGAKTWDSALCEESHVDKSWIGACAGWGNVPPGKLDILQQAPIISSAKLVQGFASGHNCFPRRHLVPVDQNVLSS